MEEICDAILAAGNKANILPSGTVDPGWEELRMWQHWNGQNWGLAEMDLPEHILEASC